MEFLIDDHLRLAEYCENWELIGRYLKMDEPTLSAIKEDCHTTEEKRTKLLVKWKEQFSKKATIYMFLKALEEAKKIDSMWHIIKKLYPKEG